MIVRFALTFHHATGIGGAQPAVRQRKIGIHVRRALKMLDRFIDVLARHRLINELGQTGTATQIFFVSFGVGGFLLLEPILLVRSQLQTQTLANLLGNGVLHTDDVGGVGIDAIAPEQIAGLDIHQLGGHANAIAGAQKAGRQNRGDAHLASGLARIDSQALVLDDFRRWPHNQASHPREFGNHRVGQREFVKA